MKRGTFVILSGPSASGKNTVFDQLVRQRSDIVRVVTTTTRTPRPNERDGVDYYFCTRAQFEEELKQGALLEHNYYDENYYGLTARELQQKLGEHPVVFAIVDINGARRLREQNLGAHSVFLMPPSEEVLRERISTRGENTPEEVERRMQTARIEMQAADEFDFVVVNDKLDQAVADLRSIVETLTSDSNS